MIYHFDEFELDTRNATLSLRDAPVALEPQVFTLLSYLIENRDRLITRDEILDAVWNGRIVSDAAIDSRVRSARTAIGDDGRAQRRIQTVRGRGLRFVGAVTTEPARVHQVSAAPQEGSQQIASEADAAQSPQTDGRPSIAVLPFLTLGDDPLADGIARALPHDLIAGLSRLRWMFVIARASSFQFQGVGVDPVVAAQRLGVRYCLCGAVEMFAGKLTVTVELIDASRGGIVWADRTAAALDDIHDIRDRFVLAILGALEVRIPLHEAERAALRSSEQLDAWGAYHLGLRHMYRFNARDNERAIGLFNRATQLDPQFSRAFAALSFAHFQNAFVNFSQDTEVDRRLTLDHAERAMGLDALEPFANYAMGRAHWLQDDFEGARDYIGRCIELNPNHAQGYYTGGLVDMLAGRVTTVADNAAMALSLSPYDPMRYGMLMLRALVLCNEGRFDEAALLAGRSAREPNAHAVMALLAAMCFELSGDRAEALRWIASARHRNPNFGKTDFFRSLSFREPSFRKKISGAFDRLGLA